MQPFVQHASTVGYLRAWTLKGPSELVTNAYHQPNLVVGAVELGNFHHIYPLRVRHVSNGSPV